MLEKRYFISDASKMVDVESHVLRYWEDELLIEIPRNEMGHRYYTDFHIKLLKNIKELKEQGFQLKAIKMLLPELMEGNDVDSDKISKMKEEIRIHLESVENQAVPAVMNGHVSIDSGIRESKIEQFQMILGNVVSQALKENNSELGKSVSDQVSESVIKEMDYLMRLRDEHEEERFKRFDETMRNYQESRKEVAATEEKKFFSRFHHKKNCRTY